MKKLHYLVKVLFGPVPVYFSALAILILLTNAQYFGLVGVGVPRASKLASSTPVVSVMKYCDIFRGEWVPDAEAPYYNHKTCGMIQEHQNCLKYGRPDLGFLKWRWRPSGCELPRFDPVQFLQFVRHKKLAFVGDSLARNHMQSLLCLLSQAAYPKDISPNPTDQNKVYYYRAYNFTINMFWSPFLVRAREPAHDDAAHTGHYSLYLDEPDGWVAEVPRFDYVLVSAANWFSRPSLFYEKRRLIGCSFCNRQYGVPDLSLYYSQRKAWRVSLQAINALGGVRGRVIVRMLSPMSHFENGTWDQGGNCKRTEPLRGNQTAAMDGRDLRFYTAQMEEYREAEKDGRAKGVRMMLMDATAAMLMRPDGHPSRYGHWPDEKVQLYNDCIHWCLPGPIDVWNDLLFQMILA